MQYRTGHLGQQWMGEWEMSLALCHSGWGAWTKLCESTGEPIRVLFVMAEELINGGKPWAIINAVHDHPIWILSLQRHHTATNLKLSHNLRHSREEFGSFSPLS